jgi:hypothetical protein
MGAHARAICLYASDARAEAGFRRDQLPLELTPLFARLADLLPPLKVAKVGASNRDLDPTPPGTSDEPEGAGRKTRADTSVARRATDVVAPRSVVAALDSVAFPLSLTPLSADFLAYWISDGLNISTWEMGSSFLVRTDRPLLTFGSSLTRSLPRFVRPSACR